MSLRGIRSRLAVAAVGAMAVSLALTGCQSDGSESPAASAGDSVATDGGAGSSDAPEPVVPPATVSTNVDKAARVSVDTPVTVDVADGTLGTVVVKAERRKGSLAGAFNKDKTGWTADDLLEPGTTYVVKTTARDTAGGVSSSRSSFTTQDLSLDEQTYPSLTPLQDEVVGVGMPVIVQFDIPVKDKAAFESRMRVTAKPAAVGSWSWISDQEVHWRPKSYWKSGTKVHVDVDVNSIDAGNGIYGQMSRDLDFKIGQSVVMKADLSSHQMRVMVDGSLARTVPITGGKPGFETRSGTKLIVEKFASKRMDAATVGITPGDPEYYNIPEVEYAQRVTFTGEFIHAAPWSVSAQGSYNASHGCVGVSTENGAWLFGLTHRGDPMEVTGTQRGLEDNNGWTDWNESFKEYREGSAL